MGVGDLDSAADGSEIDATEASVVRSDGDDLAVWGARLSGAGRRAQGEGLTLQLAQVDAHADIQAPWLA